MAPIVEDRDIRVTVADPEAASGNPGAQRREATAPTERQHRVKRSLTKNDTLLLAIADGPARMSPPEMRNRLGAHDENSWTLHLVRETARHLTERGDLARVHTPAGTPPDARLWTVTAAGKQRIAELLRSAGAASWPAAR